MAETVGDRIRQVRERCGEKQPEFAERLNAAAALLGVRARYDNTIVSKMEVGRRDVGLEDVVVISSVDPDKRGREWLAWGGGTGIAIIDPARDRKLTDEEIERASAAAERARKTTNTTSGRKRGQGGR